MEEQMDTQTTKMKLRVILSGGGVRGVYQAGVLKQIMASGKYEIDEVYGCSIGALHAPAVAACKTDELVAFYTGINKIDQIVERRSIFGIRLPDWNIVKYLFTLFKMGAYKRIKVDEMLEATVSRNEIDRVKHRCHVVAYNVTQNEETWFTGSRLIDGIKCSTALWYVVPPYKYENDVYVDGGACEYFPINYILNRRDSDFCGKYIFIDLDTRQHFTRTAPTNILGLMSNIHSAALCKVAELQEMRLRERLGDDLIIVRPRHNASILRDALDLHPPRIQQTLEMGLRDGDTFVKTMADINDGITMNQIEYRKQLHDQTVEEDVKN